MDERRPGLDPQPYVDGMGVLCWRLPGKNRQLADEIAAILWEEREERNLSKVALRVLQKVRGAA